MIEKMKQQRAAPVGVSSNRQQFQNVLSILMPKTFHSKYLTLVFS